MHDEPSRVWRSVLDVRQRKHWKSWRPLGIGSMTTKTVVQDEPSWERWSIECVRRWKLRENWRPFGIGSWKTRQIVHDRPSWEQRSIACVCWWTLGENKQVGIGVLKMSLWRSIMGTTVLHRGLVLLFSDRTEDATFILCESDGVLMLTYMFLTYITSKLAMLKHLFF